ncbi:MAG: hypothetical protein JW738_01835 [Actinobacteria bacterium]|nr:hypothetical protein [Actinomycetota bacterium]
MEKQGLHKRKGTTIAVIAVLVLLLTGLAALQYSIDNNSSVTSEWEDTTPIDTARSIVDILGGVRETLAAYFWTKTDTLHHDYFGGDISREQALYPYYWMITRLDPHFTMAYYLASWMLCRFGLVDEGFDLALEGLRYNPYSDQLQSNLAYLYFFFKKDPEKARYHILKAIELTDDKEQKEVYETFLRTVDRVLSGELNILEIAPVEKDSDIRKEVEREQHDHEH